MFEDGLALLRERERELRRFAREKRQTQRERQKQQLEAMEQVIYSYIHCTSALSVRVCARLQYYNDQFSMLAESLARQRGRAATRGKAQNQVHNMPPPTHSQ